jgi:dTMP kinase
MREGGVRPGRFLSLEGGEGSGKSTQIKALAAALEAEGHAVLLTREPGGEAQAEALRQLLVTGAPDRWDALAETLLFLAGRVQNTERVIRPALRAGNWVLSDRSLDSTRVYQGMAKGVGVERYDALHRLTLGDFIPDLTLLLDVPPELGLQRSRSRHNTETRFEEMNLRFHIAVREGFLALARAEPQRIRVVDATQPPQAVAEAILREVRERLTGS